MRDAAELLEVTEHLSAAAARADAWTSALNRLSSALNADHALIVVRENTSGRTLVATSSGMRITDFERFLSPEGSRRMEPFRRVLPAGKAVKWSEIVSDDNFERSAFYNEVVRPVDGFYAVAARQQSRTLSTFIAACRPRRSGDFSPGAATAMQMVLPHLAVTVNLRHRLRLAESQHERVTRVLDKLQDGVIVVDAEGRIVFTNRAGGSFLRDDEGLCLEKRRLAAVDPASNEALQRMIVESARGTMIRQAADLLHIARSDARDPLHAFVSSFKAHDDEIQPCDAGEGLAIVFLTDPEKTRSADKSRWRRQFGLTAAEAKFALEIVKGDGRRASAERLGISISTARAHLTHIFEKTGTRRQAALVRLLLSRGDG